MNAPRRFTGGAGADTLAGVEDLFGSQFADSLTGNAGINFIDGLGGADTLDGAAGPDRLTGGEGNDSLLGLAGAETLSGGEGNDTIDGGVDSGFRSGDAGNDTIVGDPAADSVAGVQPATSDPSGSGVHFRLGCVLCHRSLLSNSAFEFAGSPRVRPDDPPVRQP